MFCLCVKKSNKKRQFQKRKSRSPSFRTHPKSLSTTHFRGSVYKIYSNPRPGSVEVLLLGGTTCAAGNHIVHAMHRRDREDAAQLASPPCTALGSSPPALAVATVFPRFFHLHWQGSIFTVEKAGWHPVLLLLRPLTGSDRPDFSTSCIECDFGRNIQR